jgi:hypothetical protein
MKTNLLKEGALAEDSGSFGTVTRDMVHTYLFCFRYDGDTAHAIINFGFETFDSLSAKKFILKQNFHVANEWK